ncbi:MAG: YihY/virulence factor BrkB family protein [Clostridiales bacterium]|nr:YihY/virulence factor BrkB family protein [Clostridiales bacterium]
MKLPDSLKKHYVTIEDFMMKCTDDHVTAFGAMSAFFLLLTVFPIMILLLTLTKYAPFSKEDIISGLTNMLSFESTSLVTSLVNEIYEKTGASIFTASIIVTLWSSSSGVHAMVKGLNAVYDIEESRNYIMIRVFSMLCTVIFIIMLGSMLILWVFGNNLYDFICLHFPPLQSVAISFLNSRLVFTILILTILFMVIYTFLPGRRSTFSKQWPGAVVASVGWMIISWGYSFYMENFQNFSYVYGSMAGIMILLLWLYFCMSLVFYGAEINYLYENKKFYHTMVRIRRLKYVAMQREKENIRKGRK